MTKIRCVVERITYQNPDNGYSVLKVRLNGYDDLITVVGNLLDVTAGSVLSIEGDWKVDAKYGRQFIAEQWEETMPATLYEIEKYLGSGLIKGVGPKCAKKIVSAFGLETISIIEDSPKKLLSVPGIGRRRIEKITESWEWQKEVKNIRCTPQHYIPTIIKILKGTSARHLFMFHPDLRKSLWGGHLWNPSYFVATVSDNTTAQIEEYIRSQKTK